MMFTPVYVQFILAIAPLLVVGLSMRVYTQTRRSLTFVVCSVLFSIAFLLPVSVLAAVCTVPWLCYSLYLAWREGPSLWNRLYGQSSDHKQATRLLLAAFLYLPVGAAWAFADRWGLRPMSFSPIIVLLTGVHFHYAGFALPLVSGLLLRSGQQGTWWPPAWNKKGRHRLYSFLSWGVIAGVPLVALGITSSQYAWPAGIEIVAVTIMATAGLGVGIGYVIWSRSHTGSIRVLFALGGWALMGGMVLALLYGWRYVFPLSFLSIPWMYAVHGSLNSLGFVLPVLLAWNLLKK